MGESRSERNARIARTGYTGHAGDWYALDSGGMVFGATSSAVDTALFRFEAELDEEVDPVRLDRALARVARRFAYLTVRLREGFFWQYLEPLRLPPRAEPDPRSPQQGFRPTTTQACAYRARYRGRTLALELFHAAMDGTGGLRLFKNLLAEYFRQGGASFDPSGDPDLADLDSLPDPEEYEDAYQRHFPGVMKLSAPDRKAWHQGGRHLPRGSFRVTTGSLSSGELLERARAAGVSLTEYLAAVYLDALQELWLAQGPAQRRASKPYIVVDIPVNMRKFFPSKTNRNFIYMVLLSQDMRHGRRDFEEILVRAHHQMRLELDPPEMIRRAARSVVLTRQLYVRAVPLAIKYPIFRGIVSRIGDQAESGYLSNVGPVSFPAGLAERVRALTFIPVPSTAKKANLSVISYGDELRVSVGSLAASRELEKHFFRRLRSLGFRVAVACNLEA